jgi:hypothetical protein
MIALALRMSGHGQCAIKWIRADAHRSRVLGSFCPVISHCFRKYSYAESARPAAENSAVPQVRQSVSKLL